MRPAASDVIEARGHRFVTLRHPTTIEITMDNEMTRRGDCILAVGASKSAADLNQEMKTSLKAGARLLITVKCAGLGETLVATGSGKMTFRDRTSMVVRKSSYVDGRTIGVLADKAAKDIDRMLARQLREESHLVSIRFDAFLTSTSASR